MLKAGERARFFTAAEAHDEPEVRTFCGVLAFAGRRLSEALELSTSADDITLMEEVVLVLNSWPLEKMVRYLGSGSWSKRNGANEERIKRCCYLVITRHGKKEHGVVDMIARNLSVVPSDEGEDRIIIRFKEFIKIDPPRKGIWPIGKRGDQSAVRYKTLEETGIDDLIAVLKWDTFPPIA